MTDILTLQNIIIVTVAMVAVRVLVWKYWEQPRFVARMRNAMRQEIHINQRLNLPVCAANRAGKAPGGHPAAPSPVGGAFP